MGSWRRIEGQGSDGRATDSGAKVNHHRPAFHGLQCDGAAVGADKLKSGSLDAQPDDEALVRRVLYLHGLAHVCSQLCAAPAKARVGHLQGEQFPISVAKLAGVGAS